MTLDPNDLLLYAGALLILFLTPGPVLVALTARGLSGGFHAAWPLALGVAVGWGYCLATDRHSWDFMDFVGL